MIEVKASKYPKLTERLIQLAIARWSWWNKLTIPNLCLFHEMDLAQVTKAGYLWEFEIKVSQADWNGDFKKDEPEGYWNQPRRNMGYVRRFHYVYAEGLVCPEWVPEEVGLIEARYRVREKDPDTARITVTRVRKAKDRKVPKLTDRHIRKFWEAAYYRYWNRVRHLPIPRQVEVIEPVPGIESPEAANLRRTG